MRGLPHAAAFTSPPGTWETQTVQQAKVHLYSTTALSKACRIPLHTPLLSHPPGDLVPPAVQTPPCCSCFQPPPAAPPGSTTHPCICSMTSGAIQQGVPTNVVRVTLSLPQDPPRSMVAATPKSPILTLPSLSIRMFPAW